jgi:hypothetical protein
MISAVWKQENAQTAENLIQTMRQKSRVFSAQVSLIPLILGGGGGLLADHLVYQNEKHLFVIIGLATAFATTMMLTLIGANKIVKGQK